MKRMETTMLSNATMNAALCTAQQFCDDFHNRSRRTITDEEHAHYVAIQSDREFITANEWAAVRDAYFAEVERLTAHVHASAEYEASVGEAVTRFSCDTQRAAIARCARMARKSGGVVTLRVAGRTLATVAAGDDGFDVVFP